MLVEAFRGARQLCDLQTRFAIKVIAKVAGLKIEVDEADISVLCGPVAFKVGCSLYGQSSVLPTPPALGINEIVTGRWRLRVAVPRVCIIGIASPRDNIEHFVEIVLG